MKSSSSLGAAERSQLQSICAEILQSASEERETAAFYKKSAVGLIRLKILNRAVHLKLDSQRKELESKKSNMDKFQLQLENLRYKEAYLSREIGECKNLLTPNLEEIEKELGKQLGTTVYSDKLEETSSSTTQQLTDEMKSRIVTQDDLQEIDRNCKKAIEALDTKRKFLDELPVKITKLKAETTQLRKAFSTVLSAPVHAPAPTSSS